MEIAVNQLARILPNGIKPFVIIESPFMGKKGVRGFGPGTQSYNIQYARAAVRDSILRGEAPFASHLLYTQDGILRDEVHEERELGMGLGWHIMRRSDLVTVYTDLGWSSGMVRGFNAALDANQNTPEIRRLRGPWSNTDDDAYLAVGYGDWTNALVTHPDYPGTFWIEVDLVQGYGVMWKEVEPGKRRIEVVKSDRFVIGRDADNAK